MVKFITKFYPLFVAILLLVMFSLSVFSVLQESQTMDEGVHLTAGYSYLKSGDFRMNAEHPPLIKIISALPLLFTGSDLPFENDSWATDDEWAFANESLYHNDKLMISADLALFAGRLPIIILSVLFGLFLAWWASKLVPKKFSKAASLIVLILYVFSPNIIAHSRYITTDLAITICYALAVFFIGKFLTNPSGKNLIWFAIIFAISQTVKFSAIFILPIFITLYLIKYLKDRKLAKSKLGLKNFFLVLIILLALSSTAIFFAYGFEFKKPIDDPWLKDIYEQRENIDYQNLSSSSLVTKGVTSLSINHPGFIDQLVQTPLPFVSYFKGFYLLANHNYWGHTSYLLGSIDKDGHWYYFLIAFILKTSTSFIILLGISLFAYANKFVSHFAYLKQESRGGRWKNISSLLSNIPFKYYLLTIPAVIYLLISISSSLNLGLRHILPIYPFLFLLVTIWIVTSWQKLKSVSRGIIAGLLIWYMATALLAFPNYLSYFNTFAGGPQHGSQYLVDSNLDWGQDLQKLKYYLTENNINHIQLEYFGQAEPSYYGINFSPIESIDELHNKKTPPSGIYAISISSLVNTSDKDYSWLRSYTPKDTIGHSIYIYEF